MMSLEQIQQALKIGSPTPWRVNPESPCQVLDADGSLTLTALIPEDAETVVLLVNSVPDLLPRPAEVDLHNLPEWAYCGNRDRPYPG